MFLSVMDRKFHHDDSGHWIVDCSFNILKRQEGDFQKTGNKPLNQRTYWTLASRKVQSSVNEPQRLCSKFWILGQSELAPPVTEKEEF